MGASFQNGHPHYHNWKMIPEPMSKSDVFPLQTFKTFGFVSECLRPWPGGVQLSCKNEKLGSGIVANLLNNKKEPLKTMAATLLPPKRHMVPPGTALTGLSRSAR